MILSIEFFDVFRESATNSNLVADEKFGIHEFVDGNFVQVHIHENEFSKYRQRDVSIDDEEIKQLSNEYIGYPFVELIP